MIMDSTQYPSPPRRLKLEPTLTNGDTVGKLKDQICQATQFQKNKFILAIAANGKALDQDEKKLSEFGIPQTGGILLTLARAKGATV